jgi:hypothetical protein
MGMPKGAGADIIWGWAMGMETGAGADIISGAGADIIWGWAMGMETADIIWGWGAIMGAPPVTPGCCMYVPWSISAYAGLHKRPSVKGGVSAKREEAVDMQISFPTQNNTCKPGGAGTACNRGRPDVARTTM